MSQNFSRNKTIAGAFAAILAVIIWGGNFILARGVIKDIPPVTLAFYRWLSATVIMFFLVRKTIAGEMGIIKNRFWYFFLVAVSGVSVFNTFVYIAGHYSEAINLALIGTTTSPIFSVLLARIFLKEKIPFLRIAGMLICIAGILLLLSKGSWQVLLSLSFTKGDWWMLAAAFTFAVYNVSAKKKPEAISSKNFLFLVFAMGTLLLLPFYLYEWNTKGGIVISVSNIGAILYLGLGASVIAFLLWNKAIENLGAGRAALFGNLIPVFSSIGAVLFLKERITWIHITSFIIVFAGVMMATRQKKSF